MGKRKTESDHQSRLHYGNDVTTEQEDSVQHFRVADSETISSRRTVRASSLPTANVSSPRHSIGAGTSEPTVDSSDATSSKRLRKKRRMLLYYATMRKLNCAFATFCHEEENNLCKEVDVGVIKSTDVPEFYIDGVQQYISHAEKIQLLYNPSTTAGDVLTFGSGDCGQLALSDSVLSSRRPRLVNNLRNVGIIDISCGGLHNAAVTAGGKVNTWGCNDEGSLGKVDIDTAFAPIEIEGFVPSVQHELVSSLGPVVDGEDHIVSAATGDCQTLVLSNTGRVYFFGSYKDKEGNQWCDMPPPDDHRKHTNPAKEMVKPRGPCWWPVHVYKLPGKCVQIKCGASFNAAIVEVMEEEEAHSNSSDTIRRVCVTWGLGQCGELARPVYEKIKDEKYEWKEGDDSYSCYNFDKVVNDYLVPQPVTWMEGLNSKKTVDSVACGAYHLLVIANDKGDCAVYASGLNQYGQLGLNDTNDRKELTRITNLDGCEIMAVSAGVHHSLCLDKTSTGLYAFGRGDSGQLGITSSMPPAGYLEHTPAHVSLLVGKKSNPPISQISCGGNHNLVLTKDGDVFTWGYGEMGALGHGKEVDEYSPRKLEVKADLMAEKKKSEGTSTLVTGRVHLVVGGGQHSAIILT